MENASIDVLIGLELWVETFINGRLVVDRKVKNELTSGVHVVPFVQE